MTLLPAGNRSVLAICAFYVATFFCFLGKVNADVSQEGAAAVYYDIPETGAYGEGSTGAASVEGSTGAAAGDDPAQMVAKALLCFNDKHIYKSCEESYRVTASGELNVKSESTDQFCTGPCLSETDMVLNCIEGIMKNFQFYNKATIDDIKDTIHAGCGYGPERGNFNVEEHIEAERSTATALLPLGIGSMILGFGWIDLMM